jgi:hypothetical protein
LEEKTFEFKNYYTRPSNNDKKNCKELEIRSSTVINSRLGQNKVEK